MGFFFFLFALPIRRDMLKSSICMKFKSIFLFALLTLLISPFLVKLHVEIGENVVTPVNAASILSILRLENQSGFRYSN